MLHKYLLTFAIGALMLNTSQKSSADVVIGDTVNAANTFQSTPFTSGIENIFQVGSATVVDPDVELPLFADIYNVDFAGDSLTMTLANNSGLAVTQYGAGDFDRYYYGFDGHFVDSVAIASGDNELTNGLTVGLLAPGFELDVEDNFGTGIALPRAYPNGGFFLQFGEGTDLRTLNTSLSINFESTAVPEPGALVCLLGMTGLVHLRRRSR
ncbi:MAG: hypothetical protein AAGG44_19185 [Planctomycetota bacterium]